ncbi:MAG TPA: hypothetical protein VFK78_03335 [Gemmatimonadales bacterium]|nr:hypothetical protein [Gemmatimonadales bacterium]
MSASDDRKMAKLVKKLSAQAAKPKAKARPTYDDTLRIRQEEDTEVRDFFSEMKKREF